MQKRWMGSALCAVAALVAISGTAAWGQLGGKKKGDQRVEALLKTAELKYEVDKDGDFKLIYTLNENRTQIAWILSKTNKLGDLEIREIWSLAILSESQIEGDTAVKLLELNSRYKLGSWQIRKMGEKYAAVFSAQIAADTDDATLKTTLQAVTSTADEVEKELATEDKF